MDLMMFGISHFELNVILLRFSHLLFQRFAALLNRSYGNRTYHRREACTIRDPFVTLFIVKMYYGPLPVLRKTHALHAAADI